MNDPVENPTDDIEEVETSPEPTTTEPADAAEPTKPEHSKPGLKQRISRFAAYYGAHKKLMIPLTIGIILGLALAVPASRYSLLGLGLKKDFNAKILDAKTQKPVSGVTVSIKGKTTQTDQSGLAHFTKVPVGKHHLTATKKYYNDGQTDGFVPIKGSNGSVELSLVPTGRQVKAKVTNKVSGKPIKNAQVSAAGTDAKTDEKGEVTIVLPADKDSQDATITADGFNKLATKVKVTESETVVAENNLAVTPAGKVYFLSKRTGKINVMKSDLDGTNSAVVLAATGNEDDGDTILLASQDWKYLALKSKRAGAGKQASLYLIDTSQNDKLTTMDEGDASFTMTGWSGHTFVYQVQREKVEFWQPSRHSLKSYNAESAKLNVLDNTAGEGTGASSYQGTDYKSEFIGNVILVGSTVTYTKQWTSGIYLSGNASLAGKQHGIYTVGADGQNKKLAKGFDATTISGIDAKLYEPKEVYYRVYNNDKPEFYELLNGNVSPKGDLTANFLAAYPTFLASPSNNLTFWAEERDGKNTLFVGDANGDNSKTVTELSEYVAYGWFSDEYLLLSKNSSELYIIGKDGLAAGQLPVKVTDYHKPNTIFYGYGGGYGGL
jgi:hypothetical protein